MGMAQKRSLDRRQLAADLLEIAATLERGDVTSVYIARVWLQDLARALPVPRELDVVDAEDRSYNTRTRIENQFGVTDSQAVT
jgi:hypothetical protein